MSQQPVKLANGIPTDANGVPMDATWARYATNTILDIWERDKGRKITKRILTPKKGVSGQDPKYVSASTFAMAAEGR